jgi:hypothetical protein
MSYITQESIDRATQTPLTTTNNDIHYITQESIDLATQTPLTTTNNDIHYTGIYRSSNTNTTNNNKQ